MAALILGAILGACGIARLNTFFDFIAAIYTRLFKFAAVPTIALAITTTLASLGARRNAGRIFLHTIVYTLLTTVAAAGVGALLYKFIAPGNLPAELVRRGQADVPASLGKFSYYDHLLSVVPDNLLTPVLSGNVLSILLVSAAVGIALAVLRESENIRILTQVITGLQ
jgi:Na+/H+-dicarboxylate symporter